MTIEAFDWYFLPPLRNLDGATVLVLGLFLGMALPRTPRWTHRLVRGGLRP